MSNVRAPKRACPFASGERLVAAEQAIGTVTASYAAVEPPLRAFFPWSLRRGKKISEALCFEITSPALYPLQRLEKAKQSLVHRYVGTGN
jgi:hypothetical protein